MTYTPKYLKKWVYPDSYMGAHWDGYYVFLGQNRDSDSLTRSNFQCALDAIGGETGEDDDGIIGVGVIRESHWAVGWIEWIAIHESNSKALKVADEVMESLEGYPVVNETHWIELEYNEASDYWAQLSVRDRAEYIKDSGCGASIFAARRDYLPEDDTGALLEALTS